MNRLLSSKTPLVLVRPSGTYLGSVKRKQWKEIRRYDVAARTGEADQATNLNT